MDSKMKDKIRIGLMAKPKYLPNWLKYDKAGSSCFAATHSMTGYCKATSEKEILRDHLQDILNAVGIPCHLLDLGAGNCVTGRIFIDAILKQQPSLTYVPVDIADDVLLNSCEQLRQQYGSRLRIDAVTGMYSKGISAISNYGDSGMVIWFNSILNESIEDQISLLQQMSTHMKEADIAILAIDTMSDESALERIYGTNGPFSELDLSSLRRLNQEFAGNKLDLDQFLPSYEYVKELDVNKASYVRSYFVSQMDQVCLCFDLGMTLSFRKGEEINLSKWGGISHKYTLDQFTRIADRGHMRIVDVWQDKQKNAAIFCLKKK